MIRIGFGNLAIKRFGFTQAPRAVVLEGESVCLLE